MLIKNLHNELEPGDLITFDLEVWPVDEMELIEVSCEVIYICHDPLKRHESKAIVEYKNVSYGIPLSMIKSFVKKEIGQLKLF